jgi:hypothetical protein
MCNATDGVKNPLMYGICKFQTYQTNIAFILHDIQDGLPHFPAKFIQPQDATYNKLRSLKFIISISNIFQYGKYLDKVSVYKEHPFMVRRTRCAV